jgi:hypothetical protein
MTEYLFRVEGVNLNPTVYDTSDISTIRGGGFYLLSRIGDLAHNYADNLITEGASSAVFKIETKEPEDVRTTMLQSLYRKNNESEEIIPEMMFLIEFIENTGDFPELMARLIGQIRLAQMQSPNLRVFQDTLVPGLEPEMNSMGYDALNRVLPAHIYDAKKGNLSTFTNTRRRLGVKLRERIYTDLLFDDMQSIKDYSFTDNLADLAENNTVGNLSGKIAYIYIDGNKFGELQQNFGVSKLREYDKKLQGCKKRFLGAVLGHVKDYKSFLTTDNIVRLETLLWGGDEIKLVVPAWLGWKVASFFYNINATEEMKIKAKIGDTEMVCELTYAMGLVFAHHKNPIRNIDQIAVELAEAVKNDVQANNDVSYPAYKHSTGNRMQYVVLESLETLPSDYGMYAASRYGMKVAPHALSIDDMKALETFALLLDEHFSRSRVYAIAEYCNIDSVNEYHQELQRGISLCEISKSDMIKLCRAIENMTGTVIVNGKVKVGGVSMIYRWRQVAELWDYLVWKEN